MRSHNTESRIELARCNVAVIISFRFNGNMDKSQQIGKYTRTNEVRVSQPLANNLSLKNSIFRSVRKKVRAPRWNFRTPRSSGPEMAHDESHPEERRECRWETRKICSANSGNVYFPKANSRQNRDALITGHV